MAAKTSEWRPGPTVCRCCLSEGCYKDISTEYFWMGKREVYAEMLSETFDLSIAYSQSGGPNSNSRLICEPCISRLRDAADFKRQVVECEKTFLQHLDPSSSSIDAIKVTEEEPLEEEKEVKLEQVKIEKVGSDEEFDDLPNFGDDDDDDDDDMDDQPLTKLASKVPKKESVDLLDLIDNAKVAEKRKSAVKVKATPIKKVKLSKETKASASKAKPEKKKKDLTVDVVRRNAKLLLNSVTAYPFRVRDKSYVCVYCREVYTDPEVFKMHMGDDHGTFDLKLAFHKMPKTDYIKADISEMRCRLCDHMLKDLNTAAEHLKTVHDVPIELDANFGIMPFNLQRNLYVCAICQMKMPSLTIICRHTLTHFLAYACKLCGLGFATTTAMLKHERGKHQAIETKCRKCDQIFPNEEAKHRHKRMSQTCLPYVCMVCAQRFIDQKAKTRHMQEQHGVGSKDEYECVECSLMFTEEKEYYMHLKLEHSLETIICKKCGLKFTSTHALKRHEADNCE